jgi:hypothetical protein
MAELNITRGMLGRWYRISMIEDGKWVEVMGPFSTRDDTRVGSAQAIVKEPEDWCWSTPVNTARGLHGWYCVLHVGRRRWAQLAGPFRRREQAREYQRKLQDHFYSSFSTSHSLGNS